MPNPDFVARKEKEKFDRKQKTRMKGKTPEDDGDNWKLGKFFDEKGEER